MVAVESQRHAGEKHAERERERERESPEAIAENRIIDSQRAGSVRISERSWEQFSCVWAYGGWAFVWGLRRCGFLVDRVCS
jgi:hypothetical protein